MSKYRRSPRPVNLALTHAREQWAPQTLLAELQAIWPEIVGDAIAEQATPSAERAGTVTIACAAAVWAQELDLMGTSIIERLNGALGASKVSRIRCVTTPQMHTR